MTIVQHILWKGPVSLKNKTFLLCHALVNLVMTNMVPPKGSNLVMNDMVPSKGGNLVLDNIVLQKMRHLKWGNLLGKCLR